MLRRKVGGCNGRKRVFGVFGETVGPVYGLFGLGMALYFSSQGAARLLWPLLANFTRLLIAAGGGWLALHWGGGLFGVFLAQSIALAAFGLINASAIAMGAWGGKPGRQALRAAPLKTG